MICGTDFFEKRPNIMERIGLKTIENLRKIATSQENDYTIGCILDIAHF